MLSLLIWFATIGIGLVIAFGVAGWASRRSPPFRNVTGFVMAAGSSYCASFVVDMWAQAAVGSLPPSNIVMPSITWLIFAFLLAGGAFAASKSSLAIATPFVLNAILALSVSGIHVQNLTVGLVLLLLGAIVALLRRQQESRMGLWDWLFTTQERKPSFPIGGYTLNMTLPDAPPLREFSPAEYQALGTIEFVGGKIYHAPNVEFVGRRWKVNLGSVHGKLYKIALFLQLAHKPQASEAAYAAMTFCNEQLGKPTQQQTGLFVWDTTDGNVIVQTAAVLDEFAVNLFLTASSVRDFERVKRRTSG